MRLSGCSSLIVLIILGVSITGCSRSGPNTGNQTNLPHKSAATSNVDTTFTADPYWTTPNGDVFTQLDVVDHGTAAHAGGTARTNAAGGIQSYVAVSGDVYANVAERFGLQYPDLFRVNCLRRVDMRLYVGDVLNLDPHTAASVGVENGQVQKPTATAQEKCRNGLPPQH